jgi:glycosyltransferase involved in cell wall biosynthesis
MTGSFEGLRFCIVIPAYNEGRTIAKLVEKTKRLFPCSELVVVNDGSVDDTKYEAARLGATVVDHPFNLGYGVALHTGLIWAKRNGARIVVTLDADGQHDPAEITHLLSPVMSDQADLALGSRYLKKGARYKVPLIRRMGAWMFATTLSAIIRQRITDPTTGLQCLNSKVLDLYVNLPDFPEKTPDADLIIYARRHGCRILEVPTAMYADEGQDSMHGFLKSFFYVPKMLIAMLGMIVTKPSGKDL